MKQNHTFVLEGPKPGYNKILIKISLKGEIYSVIDLGTVSSLTAIILPYNYIVYSFIYYKVYYL